MSLHQIYVTQKLPISLEAAWQFFSSPHNLKTITPEYMGFVITEKHLPEKIYPGMIITYTVTPLLGIRMSWVTEISQAQPPHYFIDEQRHGPYAFWHHKHFIKEVPGGVEVSDLVHYRVPLGPIGDMINALYIRHKLKQIFDYRFKKLNDLFGSLS